MSKRTKRAIAAMGVGIVLFLASFFVGRYAPSGAAPPQQAPGPVAGRSGGAGSTATTGPAGKDWPLRQSLEKIETNGASFSILSTDLRAMAESTFLKERKWWAGFEGLTGNLDVTFTGFGGLDSKVRFGGVVSMGAPQIVPMEGVPGRWISYSSLTVKDRDGKWTFTSDSPGKYTIDCEDKQLSEIIVGALRDVFQYAALLSRNVFLMVETGDGASGGHGSPREAFFQKCQVFAHPDMPDVKDSFVFKSLPVYYSLLVFKSGHIESYGIDSWGQKPRFKYGGYGKAGDEGAWFPATMSFTNDSRMREWTFTFSDVMFTRTQ